MTNTKTLIIIFLFFASLSFAQPELDIKPNRIEFEDLFNRYDHAFLINKGDQILTIDSIDYNDSLYILEFENNLQLPFTIIPDDSIRMNVTLSGFYYVTVHDTSDTMFVYNDGIQSSEPLEVRIRFFEDEFGEFNGVVKDSLNPVDSATVYFFYNGIYLLDTAKTNSLGYYQKSLPKGYYTIGTEKEGYYVVFHDSTYDPFFAQMVELDSGNMKTINFNLKRIDDPNLSVSGQIIDSTNGVPVNKGIVIVRTGTHVPAPMMKDNPISINTDTFAGFIKPDGSYKINISQSDYFYLQAYTNSFLPGFYNDEGIASVYWQNADSVLIDNNILDKNITLVRDSSYGGGSIGGSITFSDNNRSQNFEGITILAKNINNGALYSYNFGKEIGDYKVSNIPYGTYELVAQKIGLDNGISQTVLIDPLNNQITGINITFSVNDVQDYSDMPNDIILYQNYPNPFNPSTTISYSIPSFAFTSVKVYDIIGNEVVTLVNEVKLEGSYEVVFDASRLSSGVYFYKLQSDKFVDTKKMILIR